MCTMNGLGCYGVLVTNISGTRVGRLRSIESSGSFSEQGGELPKTAEGPGCGSAVIPVGPAFPIVPRARHQWKPVGTRPYRAVIR